MELYWSLLGYSALFGMFLGLVFCLRDVILRNPKRNGDLTIRNPRVEMLQKGLQMAIDIIIFICFGVMLSVFAHATTGGYLRWFSVLMIIVSAIAAYLGLRKPLGVLYKRICVLITKIMRLMYLWIVIPLIGLLRAIVRILIYPILKLYLSIKHICDIIKVNRYQVEISNKLSKKGFNIWQKN